MSAMLCYLLFSIAVAFPINNWRGEPKGQLRQHHLNDVSVYMMKYAKPPEGQFRLDITDTLLEQGWTVSNRTLVPSAWPIYLVRVVRRCRSLLW